MKVKEAIELFENKQKFVLENKLYEIANVKSVSGNLVIVTNSKTFNLWESEISDFINNIIFDVSAVVIKSTDKKPKNYLPVNVNGLMLPNSSMKAKDKLDELLSMFDDPEKITDDFMKKANALCVITDKIVSVEKLQLDFVRLQKA